MKITQFPETYAISKTLPQIDLAAAKARVVQALGAEGFGVLTEIDIQATLKNKIGADFPPYIILGACNPRLAHQALTAEAGVGLFLPCNVVVTQTGPDVVVAAVAPTAMFQAIQSPALEALAAEVDQRLRRAVAAC